MLYTFDLNTSHIGLADLWYHSIVPDETEVFQIYAVMFRCSSTALTLNRIFEISSTEALAKNVRNYLSIETSGFLKSFPVRFWVTKMIEILLNVTIHRLFWELTLFLVYVSFYPDRFFNCVLRLSFRCYAAFRVYSIVLPASIISCATIFFNLFLFRLPYCRLTLM